MPRAKPKQQQHQWKKKISKIVQPSHFYWRMRFVVVFIIVAVLFVILSGVLRVWKLQNSSFSSIFTLFIVFTYMEWPLLMAHKYTE